MIQSSRGAFLVFLHIVVDETSEAEPLTQNQIIERMEQEGCHISNHTFRDYIKDSEEAGIIIKRRLPEGADRGAFRYWYADGWI